MKDGKTEEALQLMQRVADSLRERISNARNDSNDPLNYGRSSDSEYVKGKTDDSEESFYDNLNAVVDAVAHAPLERKFRGLITSKILLGRQLAPTGTDIANLTQSAKDAGAKSGTYKADVKGYDPRNSRYYSGFSLKGGAAQIATAEPGDFRAAATAAAERYARDRIPKTENNYQEKRKELINSILNSANSIADFGEKQRVPKDQEEGNKELVGKSQKELEDLYSKHPEFDAYLTRAFASGQGRFAGSEKVDKNAPGTASVLVHTPEPDQKGREFSIEPIEKMEPVTGRAAQGRGATKPKEGPRIKRPGTVRFDVNAPKEGEGTLSQTRQQVAAELEQQSSAAQQDLAAAEQEKADAQRDLETNPDGTKTYLQHRAQKIINNPNLNSRLTAADNAVQAANTTIADIQARASQAAEKPEPKPQAQQQTQPQRTEPVDTKPTTEPKPVETPKSQEPQQTPKPQEPQQTPKPQEPQQTPKPQEPQETSVDKKERGRKKLEARMDASGQRLGLQ